MFCPSFGAKQGQNPSPRSDIKNYLVLEQKPVLINHVLVCLSSHNILQHFLQENENNCQYNIVSIFSLLTNEIAPESTENALHEYLQNTKRNPNISPRNRTSM